jgi:hypothetical protein
MAAAKGLKNLEFKEESASNSTPLTPAATFGGRAVAPDTDSNSKGTQFLIQTKFSTKI